MSNDSQLDQLQQEWRQGVTKKLDYLTEKIDNMPVVFANRAEFNNLKVKIESLESARNKAIGIIIAIQFVLTVAGYFFAHYK